MSDKLRILAVGRNLRHYLRKSRVNTMPNGLGPVLRRKEHSSKTALHAVGVRHFSRQS
jgi:hypothetical protein